MANIERLSKRLKAVNGFMFFLLFLWVFSAALLTSNLSKLQTGQNGITAMVVGSDAEGQDAGAVEDIGGSISSMIYFVGFVLFGGVLFVASRYSGELKSVLKIEKDKETFKTSPKAALADFFKIMINWSIKNSPSTKSVLGLLQKIKKENKDRLELVSEISFELSGDREDIEVRIDAKPEWEQLYGIFRLYLKELDIDRERFLHIAEYLGKNDVAIILNGLDEVKAKEKADSAGGKAGKGKRK